MFHIQLVQWKEFYLLPFETTVDNRLRVFQYKITHNSIYTNQRLYGINLCLSDKCKRCFTEVETLQHMFVSCLQVKRFWIYVKKRFSDALVDNLELTTNCILFGQPRLKYNVNIVNHLLLIGKRFLYDSRLNSTQIVNSVFERLVESISKTEKRIANRSESVEKYNMKWSKVNEVLYREGFIVP